MKKRYLIVLCLLLLLAGCAKAPAEPAVTATTAPTVPATETTKPTKPEPTEVTLPWDFPEVESMTYEEYFSEKREITEVFPGNEPVGVEAKEMLFEKNGTSICYFLEKRIGELALMSRPSWYGADGKQVVVTLCKDDPSYRWYILSKDKAFGVRDDQTIVMLDFRTMEKTDLYTQEDGIVFIEMLYADYRLLYFVAGTEDGYFLYRMYLPEKRLDCMTDQVNVYWLDWNSFDLIPLDVSDSRNRGRGDKLFCTDNQSVCWEEANPDYWERFRERWAEEYPKLENPEDRSTLRDWLRGRVHSDDYLCSMNRFRTDGKTVTQEKTEDWIGPADAEAVAEIQKLFDQDSPWYRYLASCDFSQADLLNVSDLFGQGDYPVVPFTEDMRAGLEALGYEDVENLTLMHVSAEEVEQVLKEYMGVTLEDTMGMAEDPNGGYLAVKRDSCWNFHLTGGSVFYDSNRLYVTGTVESNEGMLTVHMNLKKVDGAWLVRSGYCY